MAVNGFPRPPDPIPPDPPPVEYRKAARGCAIVLVMVSALVISSAVLLGVFLGVVSLTWEWIR